MILLLIERYIIHKNSRFRCVETSVPIKKNWTRRSTTRGALTFDAWIEKKTTHGHPHPL